MGARGKRGPESINGQKSSNFDLFLFLLFPFSIVYLLGEAIFLALKKPKKKADSEEPDYEWQIWRDKEGSIEPDAEVSKSHHNPIPAFPIQGRAGSSELNFEKTLTRDVMAPHFTRIRNIILAPFTIGLATAIFPYALVLVIPFIFYTLHSFYSAVARLQGTLFKRGVLIPVLLTLPAAVSFARYQAFYDGCISIGGWECSEYDNSGPAFNSLLLVLPLGSVLALLLSMSDLDRDSLLAGLFYGFVVSIFVFVTFTITGITLYFAM